MMSTSLSRTAAPRRLSLLTLLSLVLNLLPAPPASAAPAPQAASGLFVRVLNLPVNDIAYDKLSQKIFASVPSSAGTSGNTVTEIDPLTGARGESVYVGSEPNKLAVSEDGQALYVGLDGAAAVRRVDVATRTAGVQFALGAESFSSSPYLAGDLAVLPGNPNAVAVARVRASVSPPGSGVAVFENGVQRPNVASQFGGPTSIAFGATASTLYGSGLQTLSVDNAGVTFVSSSSVGISGEIQFAGGLIYNERGQVFNPSTNSLAGTFANVGFGSAFVVDPTAGRAYYIVNAQTPVNQTVTLRAYDLNTFTPLGEVNIGGVVGTPTSLIRWGANGLAFRTGFNQLFLIQTSLVPSPDPVPDATPTPEATPTPTPFNTPATVKQLVLNTKDLIYSPSSQTIYASLPSSAGAAGNSVVQLDPVAVSVGTPVFVGSEPNKLALSDDGQYLYVGLNGAAAVRRFETATQTPGPQFYLGADDFNGPLSATDIAVMPGVPQSFAVTRSSGGSSTTAAVYDNGTQRPGTAGDGRELEFGPTATRLYTGGNPFGGSFRHDVNAGGVSFGSALHGNGGNLKFAGGLLYTANGSVVDPETNTLKGTFTAEGLRNSSLMTVDVSLGRAYFLTTSGQSGLLRVFDINTFLLIGQATIPVGFTTNPAGFERSSLIRWGGNGLAFRTTTHVHFIQSTLINPSGAVPEPTPTPTATPSPSPTPQPTTFVRRLAQPVNDFAYSKATQKLYVSVPSTAGTGGNSIVEVEPSTGAGGTPVFVGSEPQRLAISDDGQVIWSYLDGARAIRRFEVATRTPGAQFAVNFRPGDMEVMPGSPQTLAVATGGEPFIYDNGVQRPAANTHPGPRAGLIEFSADPSVLYGFNNGDTGFDFYRMRVGSAGVTTIDEASGLVGGGFAGSMRYFGGRMYSAAGRVFDPETLRPIALLANAGSSAAVAVDANLKRVFYATEGSGNMVLRAYDTETFLPIGEVTLPFFGTPSRLERWGENGLALRAFSTGAPSGNLYLIQSELVAPTAAVPTGVMISPQFANTIFSEALTEFNIPVLRTGDLSVASTVEYATSDGTATERGDYITALGTLRFAPGESSKLVRILAINDVNQEGTETFNLTLSAPTGAQLVAPDVITISIADNDFSPSPSNPIDNAQFFVRQHYHDFLNRVPDPSGFNFWTNEITVCGSDQQCREVKRNNVSAAFFLSIEFQNTGYLVYRLHQASFATGERLGMRVFLKDTQEIGQGVVVGAADWEASLETNKRDFIARFVARPEFAAAYPATLTAAQFVDALNANTKDPAQPASGGSLTQAERDQLVAELTAGTKTRAEVLRVVAENLLFSRRQFNRAFVHMQYVGYLRRSPNATPDTDFAGYNFWLSKLNEFDGNYINAEMVKAFITSIEYRQRFAP